ncbi:unnamed protein product [Brachionus calyciflorus]|uniref:Tetratricopeptide repeat protein n=1 Tax=Brachionus calyciflorus TaxID=104777 RepID=A0A814QFN2_9BILA|nr:unnamed protein product [Brachionus calyciflorus]
MSDSKKILQKANNLFKGGQYQESLYCALDVYKKLRDETPNKKRLTYNLAVLYTRLNQPEEAKSYLDKINDDSYIFSNLKDIAFLPVTLNRDSAGTEEAGINNKIAFQEPTFLPREVVQ